MVQFKRFFREISFSRGMDFLQKSALFTACLLFVFLYAHQSMATVDVGFPQFHLGLGLALMFLLGQRIWPLWTIGVLMIHFLSGSSLLLAMGVAALSTAEIFLARWMLMGQAKDFDPTLSRAWDYGALLLKAGTLCAGLFAGIGGLLSVSMGALEMKDFSHVFWCGWLEGFFSVAAFYPLLLLRDKIVPTAREDRKFEAAALFFLTLLAGQIMFLGWFPAVTGSWYKEPVLGPFIVWAAMRFGPKMTISVVLVALAQSFYGVTFGTGYFSGGSGFEPLHFWFFFGQRAILGLLLAMVLDERKGIKADLSRHRKMERDLRVSGAWFRELADHMPQLIWTCLESGPCDYLSRQWVTYTGVPEREQLGYGWLRQVHPEDRERVIRAWKENVAAGGILNIQFRVRRADGEYRWFQTTATPIRDGRGKIKKWLGSNTDTHELTESQQRYNGLVQTTEGIVWEADAETFQFTFVSEQAEKLLGYPSAAWLQNDFWPKHIHPEDREQALQFCAEAMPKLQPYRFEYRMIAADGRIVWIEDIASVVAKDGVPKVLRGIMIDISSKKETEAILREAKSQAEQANAAKTTFLANMSHEIRTPMNGVLGMLHLVRKTDLTLKQKEYLDTASQSADHLLTILSNILDLSKIEAGEMIIDRQPFRIRQLLHDTLAAPILQARQKGVVTEIHVEEDVPKQVFGDPVRLAQIILNVFGNAVKFTNEGSIAVKISKVHSAGDLIRFQIKDTGIGISKDKIDRIFEPFRQADESATRTYQGTGLGLSICRNLVSLMGGKIGVESVQGQGSEFNFSIPLSKADENELVEISFVSLREQGRRLNVLMAEDDWISGQIQRLMLEENNCEVTVAKNGLEALHLARNGKFDLIFLDMQMPLLDGIETARKIRSQQSEISLRTPIFALTANAFKSDRDACLAAGMDGFLSKPIRIEELCQILQSCRFLPNEDAAENPILRT